MWNVYLPALLINAFVLAGAYIAFASGRLEKRVRTTVHALMAGGGRQHADTVSFDRLGGLPAPVQRYLTGVLTEGEPIPRRVRMSQDGDMRLREGSSTWHWFSAREYLRTDEPAFLWDARLSLLPAVDGRVVDGYLGGQARMEARVMSALPLARKAGGAELAQGALLRYLAEAVWCPVILLPNDWLTWAALDERCARATLCHRGIEVTADFHFSDANEVECVAAEGRYREMGGAYVLTPWSGYYRDYHWLGGMRVPRHGAARWHLPGGDFTYWRGRLRGMDPDPAPSPWE